jgi:hypothetical protein
MIGIVLFAGHLLCVLAAGMWIAMSLQPTVGAAAAIQSL